MSDWTFTGNVDEYAWVTEAEVKANAYKAGYEYGKQVDAMLGEDNPPIYAKKGDIIQASINKQYANVNNYFIPDYSLGFWGPLVLQDEFAWGVESSQNPTYGVYQLKSTGIARDLGGHPCGDDMLPNGDYLTTGPYNGVSYGSRPFEFTPPTNVHSRCDSPVIPDAIISTKTLYPGFLPLRINNGYGPWIKAGTLQVTEIKYQNGATGDLFFVPIPEIPVGLPDVPVFDYGVGPAGPPGPPGPPGSDASVTLENMDAAVLAGPQTALVAFLNDASIVSGNTPNNLLNVYSSIDSDKLTACDIIALRNDKEIFFPKPTLSFETGVEATFDVAESAAALPYYQLLLPAAVIAALLASVQTIRVPVCGRGIIPVGPGGLGNNEGDIMQEQQLPFPVLDVQGASQILFFQWLANAIGALMRCCPPCEPPVAEQLVQTFSEPGVFYAGDAAIEKIHLSVHQPTSVDRTTSISVGNIGKFGHFRFIYEDGTFGELDFCNSIDERRTTKSGVVRSVEVTPQFGVVIDLFVTYVEPRLLLGGYGRP